MKSELRPYGTNQGNDMEEPHAELLPLMSIYRDGDSLDITFYGEAENGQTRSVSRSFSYAAAIGLATQIIQSAGRHFEKPSGQVIVLEDLN